MLEQITNNPADSPSIQQQLERLERLGGANIGEIAIMGGGISGLVAAYELARLGYRSVIFEASNRIGGRILTTDYEGQTGELGAMRIPATHEYVLHYVNALGLQLGQFIDKNGNAFYDIRDHVVRIKDGQPLAELFDLSEYEQSLTKKGLSGVLDEVAVRLLTSVNANDIAHLYSGNFEAASPWVSKLDGMSFLEFISQHTQSRGALELVSAVNAMRDLWHSSCTGLIREIVSTRHNGLHEITTGMSALPNGIYAKLTGEYSDLVTIHLGTEVANVQTGASGVTFDTISNGASTSQSFEYALCTLPFTVLRRMQIGGLSSGKEFAIANYNYADSTKVTLNFKKRFWESMEQPIFGGASLTDSIIVQCYYPSNHATGYLELAENPTASRLIPLQTPYDLDLETTDQPPMQNPGPGVLLASYSWGHDARRLSALPVEARIETVKNYIKRFHDSADVDTYFDGGASMAWHEYQWSAGAFARLAPRDLQLYFLDAIRPEGNLYFSGEHLSHEPGWIQGSLMSTLSSLGDMLQTAVISRNAQRAIEAASEAVTDTLAES